MTLPQAAKRLRLSDQLLRVWIQNGNCPFGLIIRDGQRKTYLINDAAFRRFIEGDINNDGNNKDVHLDGNRSY